jgi:uncharacterized protein (TIGR00369 family)
MAPLTEDEQEQRRAAIAELMLATNYIAWLGASFDRHEHDHVVLRVPFRAELTNDGTHYHGGVIASAIDTAGAGAAWSNHDFDKGTRASTVSLSVQYVGSAKQSDLVCTARAVKRGKELIFVEITAADADDTIVAHAVLTYRIV